MLSTLVFEDDILSSLFLYPLFLLHKSNGFIFHYIQLRVYVSVTDPYSHLFAKKSWYFLFVKVYEIVYLSLYHSAIPQVTRLFLIPQRPKSLLSGCLLVILLCLLPLLQILSFQVFIFITQGETLGFFLLQWSACIQKFPLGFGEISDNV